MFVLMAVCFYVKSFGQEESADSSQYCSRIISQISYYWKLDSLTNNGFRLCAYKDILNSKIDKVYRGLLLDKLGRPNATRKTNFGTEYVYYFYDSKAMPEEKERPFECLYISFVFGEFDKYLSSIEEGLIDY